jgi:hypothetical protein
MNYIYLDIETCPINKEIYYSLETKEEKLKLLNPIDSKIVAIGLKYSEENTVIIQEDDEKKLLELFWKEISKYRSNSLSTRIVGFNIVNFDMSFIITRSFINKVKIIPITLSEIIDLRELVSFFRYGKTRGGLKDFGKAMGIALDEETSGENIADLCFSEDKQLAKEKIETYLRKDIELTESMHKQIIELDIDKLRKYR